MVSKKCPKPAFETPNISPRSNRTSKGRTATFRESGNSFKLAFPR